MLGLYPDGPLQSNITEVRNANDWLIRNGASGITFAGDFIDFSLNPSWNVPAELNASWNNGFVPFVNLMPPENAACRTPDAIARGDCDTILRDFANHFKTWANGGQKKAFLAPLPEMNGYWVPYYSSGAAYRAAFLRFRRIFDEVGVPRSSVRWVFAPNGWHDILRPETAFENYYPGDSNVDVVAFSAYNFGGCPADSPWRIWDGYETAMKPYLERLSAMAPGKPLFLAQTGSVNVPDDPRNPSETRDNWLRDTLSKLAAYPALRGIIYFNHRKAEGLPNCAFTDYRVWRPEANTGDVGLIDAMKNTRFGRWAPTASGWQTVAFIDPPFTFIDVQPAHPFAAVSNVWYYSDVLRIFSNGLTAGCRAIPLTYCPNDAVTRAQMAVFLQRGKRGSGFTPSPPSGRFADSRGHWAEAWIEALFADAITAGCGPALYCPETSATRAQMAVFVLRAKNGPTYTPPPARGNVFSDVPASHWAAAWIEAMAFDGAGNGCSTARGYCPDQPITRGSMAAFLVRAFNLP